MEEPRIISAVIDGKGVSFYCKYPEDHINKYHLRGEFYERMELDLIHEIAPSSPRILEVGANIGNHIMYYAMFMAPKSITWIEPNFIACEVLEKNVALNCIGEKTNVRGYPGIALSNTKEKASITYYPKNIGGARVREQEEGMIQMITGDELLQGDKYDFIKLDTEIQDIEALDGLSNTIRNSKAIVFIEIFDNRKFEFMSLLEKLEYRIVLSTKRYKLNSNYIITPKK